MKKSKIIYIIGLSIILTGCGISNMVSKYETVSYTVTPPILQTHGGKVVRFFLFQYSNNVGI